METSWPHPVLAPEVCTIRKVNPPKTILLEPDPVCPQVPSFRVALEMRGDEYFEIAGCKVQAS